MNNKLKLLPLLGVLPFFLMANSVYPYGEPEPYNKFEISDLTYGIYHDSIHAYEVQLNVKNTGNYFLSFTNFYIAFDKPNKEFWRSTGLNGNCVCPGETEPLLCFARTNTVTLEDLSFDVSAYKVSEVAKYEKITYCRAESFEEVGPGTIYQYYYDLKGLEYNSNYYNSLLVEYEIEGKKHAHFNDGSIYDGFFIETTYATTNPSEDITIKNIYLVRGINKSARDIEDMWTVVWVCTGIALGIGLFVSPAFIPLIIYGAKKRAKVKKDGNK